MDLGLPVRVPWVPEKFQKMAQSFRSPKEPHLGEAFRVPGPRVLPALHPKEQPQQAYDNSPQLMLSQMLSLQTVIH
jgi:hypothetical protein